MLKARLLKCNKFNVVKPLKHQCLRWH